MKSTPLIAEIVGPSGAGKSTLSGELNNSDARVRAGITIWGLSFSLLLKSALASLPSIALLCLERRGIRRQEVKQVIRLEAFYRHLKTLTTRGDAKELRAFFLDEGVVFALAKLRADGGMMKSAYAKQWEQKALDRWSEILDAIVWLDAPDALLVERIRSRAKDHRMKFRSDAVIYEFLARYRASYKQVISELQSRSRIRIIKLQSDNNSLELVTKAVLSLAQLDETAVINK